MAFPKNNSNEPNEMGKLQKNLSQSIAGVPLHALLSGIGTILIVGLFYWPFTAKFFMGDDWLWLVNAYRTMSEPGMLLERPIYGYFRPAAMIQMIAFLKTVGPSPLFFGTLNAVLHAVNVILLYRVLVTFGADRNLAKLASVMFAFYYLNAPAIAWISSAGDLWVTALTLGAILATYRHINTPSIGKFIPVIILVMIAMLMKESGIVIFPLYFLIMGIEKQNPFKRPHATFTYMLMALVGIYLILYFNSITTMDKQIHFGFATLINGWYFIAYTMLPLTERIVSLVPGSLHWLLVGIKVLVTIGIPVLFWKAWRHGGKSAKLFIGWTVFYVGTISLFQWDVGLFTLYPERTASRYMYSPNVGMMVLLAWMLRWVWQNWFRNLPARRIALTVMAAVFILVNCAVIYKVTGIYRSRQASQKKMYDNLVSVMSQTDDNRVIILLPPDNVVAPLVASPGFVEGMLFVGTGRAIEIVRTTESYISALEREGQILPMFRYEPASDELLHFDPVIKPSFGK